jgi:hypothetical protein
MSLQYVTDSATIPQKHQDSCVISVWLYSYITGFDMVAFPHK